MDDTLNAIITPKTILIVLFIMFAVLAVIAILLQQSLNQSRTNYDTIVNGQGKLEEQLNRIDDKLSASPGDNATTNIFPS